MENNFLLNDAAVDKGIKKLLEKGKEDKPDTGKLMATVCGRNAESLCHTIVRENLVSRMEHAAYLGREIQKAQIALNSGLNYEQDVK